MTTHYPADIGLAFEYRALEDKVGAVKAAFLWHKLWSALAFQTRAHGQSGIFQAAHLPRFRKDLEAAELTIDPIDALAEAELVKRLPNGDLFCQIFAKNNPELDGRYARQHPVWWAKLQRFETELREKAAKLKERVNEAAYYLKDGRTIPEATMQRAVCLVIYLDTIFKVKTRKVGAMGVPLLQAACAVVEKYPDAKLHHILSRSFMLARDRNKPPEFPNNTEDALATFDDLATLVLPDGETPVPHETEKPDYNNKETRTLGRELQSALSGVSAP